MLVWINCLGSFLNVPPTVVVVLWRSAIESRISDLNRTRRRYSAFTFTDNGSDRLPDSVSAIEYGVALIIKIVSYAFAALRS